MRNPTLIYFERFLGEHEHRFEKEYGYLLPIMQDVVNNYLYKRHLLSDLSLCGKEALLKYFKAAAGKRLSFCLHYWVIDLDFLCVICLLQSQALGKSEKLRGFQMENK